MRKAHSFCASIFRHTAKLCRARLQKTRVIMSVVSTVLETLEQRTRIWLLDGMQLSLVSMVLESLEHRTLLSSTSYSNAVSLVNGLLRIQGSSSVGSSLTANLVNNGTAIDASADDGHAITVPLSSVKEIQITGGNGNDYIYVDDRIDLPVTINGENGNDTIRGGGGTNTITVGSGDSWVDGRGTNDVIQAGNGDDTLLASMDKDTITAGSGNDSIVGGDGDAILTAGNGNDTVNGGSGNDTITVGTGKDLVIGGSGNDSLVVGNGPSTVYPGEGTNHISLAGPLPTVVPSAGKNTVVRASGTSTSSNPSASPTSTPSSGSSSGSSGSTTTAGSIPTGSTSWATASANKGSGTAPRAVMQVMAPAPYVGIAVVTQAINSVLGNGLAIDANYQWNFGDPSGQYNTLPGFNASHIYNSPGTYTITLTVTNDLNQSSSVSAKITIGADNRRPIYVNASTGNDSNNGSSPTSAVKTAARADQLVGNDTEVFFARGQEFNLNGAFKLNYHNVLVGAYGTGANPIINDTLLATGAVIFTTNSTAAAGVTIEDLTITTLNGSDPHATDMPMGVMAGGFDTSVVGCTFDYVEYDINASAAPTGLTAIGNSSPINGALQAYFLWDQAVDSTVLGNYAYGSVNQHILRTSGAADMLIADNNFSNFDGKGCIEVHEGSWAWVQGNTVNSGDIRVGPLGLFGEPVSDGTDTSVVQGNTVINTDINVYPGAHDVAIRDNIISRNGSNMINLIGQDGLGRQSSDIQVLNNTGISTASTGQFLVVENHVDGILMENNLLVMPNLATGGFLTAPVYVTEANLSSFTYINGNVWQQPKTIYQYANGGINFVATSFSINGYLTPAEWNAEPQVGTDYFSNTPLSGYTPTSGVAMAADAPALGVFTDINGNARPLTGAWSAGAVQV